MAETIKGITVVLGADTTALGKALGDVNKKSKDIQSELRQVDRLLKLDPSNTEVVAQKQKLLSDAVSNTSEKLNKLKEAQSQVNDQFAKGEISEGQYRAFEREIVSTEQNLKSLEQRLKETYPAVETFGEKVEKAAQKMGAAGEKMTSVGKDLSMKVTAPIVALGTLSAKAAVDFESAFAGVRKTVDATEEEFAALEKGIRDMSKQMPASAVDIAAVGEAAGQLGIETANILKFTETMIGLGEATNLTAEEGATQFARFANIVGMSQNDFDRLGSSVVALGNEMATTEAEIVAMSMRLAAQGKQVGMSESQIMALAATMSSLGIEAEAGGTAMTTVLKKMQTAVADMATDPWIHEFASMAKVSAEEFAEAFKNDPIVALDMFVKGMSDASANGENLSGMLSDLGIKGIREADTLLRMAGASDLLANAVDTATQAWEENTALSDEVAQRYATTESQMEMLKNQIIDIAIQIGEILIPIIRDVIEAVQPWIQKFSELDDGTKKVIVIIAGLAAALGPLLIIVGQVIAVVSKLAPLFTFLTGPIGLVIAAIAGIVVALVTLYKENETFRNFIDKTWEAIKNIFVKSWEAIKNTFTTVMETIKKLFNAFSLALKGDWDGAWQAIKEVVPKVMDNVINFLKKIDLKQIGIDLIQGLINGITSMISKITDTVKKVANTITNGIKNVLDINSPSKVTEQLGKWTGEGLVVGMKNTVNAIHNQAEKLATAAVPNVQQQPQGSSVATVPNISFEGMFAGANISVRSDDDIKALAMEMAREMFNLQQQAIRGAGIR